MLTLTIEMESLLKSVLFWCLVLCDVVQDVVFMITFKMVVLVLLLRWCGVKYTIAVYQ